MKRLRDKSDQERQAEALAARRAARSSSMLCSGVLPKPMPGSSTICSRAMPARAAMSSERSKNAITSAMMSIDGIGLVAVVHDDHRYAMLGDHARHVGIALQAPDVVDDRGALPSAQAATSAFMVSIETGRPSATTLGQDRRKTRELCSSAAETGAMPP